MFAAGMLIKDVIAQLEASLNNVIETAGKEARQTIMTASQQATLAIMNLKVAYSESMNQTFDKLNETERKVFSDISSLIGQLNETLKTNIAAAATIGQQIDVAASRIPLSNKEPRVLRYSPVYYVAFGKEPTVPVHVYGSLIGAGKPTLAVGGQTFSPSSKTDMELTFLVPAKQLTPPGPQLQHLSAMLTLFKEHAPLIGKRTFLPRTYPLLIYGVPQVMGKFDVTATRNVKSQERKSLLMPPGSWIEIYSGDYDPREDCFSFSPDPGWAIDTQTVKFVKHHEDTAHYGGIRNLTAAGFCILLHADAKEPHNKLIGLITGRGHISGQAAYDEVREVTTPKAEPVSHGQLQWSVDVPLSLPSDTVGFSVTIDFFNNEHRVFPSGINDRFLIIDYDQVTKQLTLKPKAPDIALN